MPPKRKSIGRSTSQGRSKKISRASESVQQRNARLEADRIQTAQASSNESIAQRETRLGTNRERNVRSRRTLHADLNRAAFHYDAEYDYSLHPSVVIDKMDKLCKFCDALKFKNETPGMCCAGGKVKLPELHLPPEPLSTLISGATSQSKHFLRNIRKYNSCFQMTSFSATEIIRDNYMPTFKVQGQICHRVGSLLPLPDSDHKFLQIYFMGNTDDQVNQRCRFNSSTNQEIVSSLQNLLDQHNELVRLFKTAIERMPTDDYVVVIRADKTLAGHHERRFNAPTIDEVAILIVGEEFNSRDIVIHRRDDNLQRVSETHRSYDALQYPILFWQGEDGYHFNIKMRDPKTGAEIDKKISAMNFYSYRLMSRANRDNHILKCRTLFQQYIVDMYVKIETERLLFIRLNQTKLRSENYIHLRDAIATDENPNDLRKMIILPATFAGSPRHMHEYAQDAMTYVRVYGRPDLFITFTCNPRWEEIRELLLPGQSPSDRPDIIARVFNQKLRALMHFIVKYRVFGASQCWMYSIEWQKRGLPHAHILIWLIDKITPDQIDQVISTEIPDIAIDPDLFEVVAKNMIHGPCGAINNNSPCMKDGKCTKRYPRDLHAETITGVDGYPQYRRRSTQDGGKCITIKVHNIAIEVDNRWIVPYSPLLSRTFKAHINVEYCNSVKSIKYICKYVNKGSDMAVFGVKNASAPIDEVQRYQLGRYICSNEAVWRILSFSIHERYPTVVHLAVHLENGQRVYFTAENVRERAASPPQTTLTAFFSLCRGDLFAKTLRYSDVPKYYTWNASEKKFQRRKQGKPVEGHPNIYSSDALGRLYTVHPSNQECFYLRLLLVNVCGPESFQELRTVNGKVCSTYREACQELYLLENDAHWDTTLADASSTAQPHKIRMLFAILLTTCFPSKPMDLWEKYKDSMSEDILHHLRAANLDLQFTPEIYNRALVLIEDICLAIANKRLGQMGLCAPNRSANDSYDRDLQRETHFDVDDLSVFVERNLSKLVPEQRIAYDTLMQAISDQRGGLYFLDAPGGTGKTFLINLILATIRSRNEIAVAIASSGIAATLLDGGRTAHSALKLPLNLHTIETPTCNISKNSGMGKVLQTCKLIIWDECTMAQKKGLEALDRTLKDLRANGNSFGGALILLSGDFRQTLPVIPRSTPADELNACLKSSVLWPQVKKLMLKTNMRVHLQNDASAERFAKQLLNIGNGKMTIDPTSQCITLPTSFCTLTSSKEELIQKVFPNIAQNYRNLQWLSERAILAAKNIDVNDINFCVQNWVPGEERTYTSIDTVLNEDEAVNYPTEFLNCLDLPGFPPHVLQLKTGVPIILLRNINPPKLCNGTRLSVKTMMNNIIEATILNGKFKGQDVLLPRIPLFPPDLPFEFKRLQFPVRTAFSMTINKAQGQSLKVCGLNLEVPCFSHGQLYVASSRVGNPSNLYVYTPDKTGTYTCNSSNGLFRYLHLQQFQWFMQVPTPATVPMVYAVMESDNLKIFNLLEAVRKGDLAKIKYLINEGVDVNGTDKLGQTPLHLASESGNLNVIKLLIEYGADIEARNSFNQTPLHFAAKHEHTSIIIELINSGALVQRFFKDDVERSLHLRHIRHKTMDIEQFVNKNMPDLSNLSNINYTINRIGELFKIYPYFKTNSQVIGYDQVDASDELRERYRREISESKKEVDQYLYKLKQHAISKLESRRVRELIMWLSAQENISNVDSLYNITVRHLIKTLGKNGVHNINETIENLGLGINITCRYLLNYINTHVGALKIVENFPY
ncbi:hypothetical protein LAZ67_15003037 [Cordylochernes scorpioides]|uniref:ATP-dependent DNA helicase n=1 Tax=Cordylochernes scorpioides TaxID=51811 RepID=A0ABY6LB66_9ARAC|nr:hypothetical protein LAZ67_15003037 [Cordylochernes scorpioides]